MICARVLTDNDQWYHLGTGWVQLHHLYKAWMRKNADSWSTAKSVRDTTVSQNSEAGRQDTETPG